jgi:hypothetical protein
MSSFPHIFRGNCVVSLIDRAYDESLFVASRCLVGSHHPSAGQLKAKSEGHRDNAHTAFIVAQTRETEARLPRSMEHLGTLKRIGCRSRMRNTSEPLKENGR